MMIVCVRVCTLYIFFRLINSEINADPPKPHNHKTDYSINIYTIHMPCNRFKKLKAIDYIDKHAFIISVRLSVCVCVQI